MWIIKWVVNSLAVMLAALIIPGVEVIGFWTALWLVVFLGLINIVIRPFLILLTLPINLLTFGLFTFVINAVLILFASSILKGFFVQGFWAAVLFSIVLSIFTYALNSLFQKDKEIA
ncbi:MAG: phage holin family protein [bacterium]